MTLEEIVKGSSAERRVDGLKANAKAASDRAKQIKRQAETSAEQLKQKQSRQKLLQLHRSSLRTTIKPYA